MRGGLPVRLVAFHSGARSAQVAWLAVLFSIPRNRRATASAFEGDRSRRQHFINCLDFVTGTLLSRFVIPRREGTLQWRGMCACTDPKWRLSFMPYQ
jgi:hypothetical protein